MAYFVRVIALLLLIAFKSAYAGYAQVSPPPSVVVRGPNTFAKLAANDAVFGRVVVKEAVINVGGQAVKMPAAMRFASNAPHFAARVVALNPYVAVAVAAVGVASWVAAAKFQTDGVNWLKEEQELRLTKLYQYGVCPKTPSINALASCVAENWSFGGVKRKFNARGSIEPLKVEFDWEFFDGTINHTVVTDIFVFEENVMMPKIVPATVEQVEEELPNYPMPQTVPKELPKETEFPVEPLPFLNPKMVPRPVGDPLPPNEPNLDPSGKPRPIGDPGVPYEPELDPSGKPQPRPLRVPIGDPVQEPVTETQPDPNKYRQPVIDVVPSPTPDDPWRVDLRPRDIISENPNPMDGPKTVPNPSDSTSTEPAPKTEEKTPGMCDLYPDILACVKPELDTPEADELKSKEIDIQLNPDGGWSTGGGACPPARQLHVANVQFDIKGVCDGLTMLRPVVLAFAWLLAAVIVVGATKKD